MTDDDDLRDALEARIANMSRQEQDDLGKALDKKITEEYRKQMAADAEDRGNPSTMLARLSRLLGWWLAEEWVAANPPQEGDPFFPALGPNDPMYSEWRRITHAAIELAINEDQYPADADPENKYLGPKPPMQ